MPQGIKILATRPRFSEIDKFLAEMHASSSATSVALEVANRNLSPPSPDPKPTALRKFSDRLLDSCPSEQFE